VSDSPCTLDLRVLAAEHGYRYAWDESFDPEHVPHDKRDTWYVRVVGTHGDIFPRSPSAGLLGVFLKGRRKAGQVAPAVLALPGASLYTDGDDGMTLTFPVAHFARVAELIRCYRRRQYTPEQREAMAARARAMTARRRHDKTGGFDRERPGQEGEGGPPAA
jgi:hypothetical protein